MEVGVVFAQLCFGVRTHSQPFAGAVQKYFSDDLFELDFLAMSLLIFRFGIRVRVVRSTRNMFEVCHYFRFAFSWPAQHLVPVYDARPWQTRPCELQQVQFSLFPMARLHECVTVKNCGTCSILCYSMTVCSGGASFAKTQRFCQFN